MAIKSYTERRSNFDLRLAIDAWKLYKKTGKEQYKKECWELVDKMIEEIPFFEMKKIVEIYELGIGCDHACGWFYFYQKE